ncbi:MAG TPA: hypothetical protein VGL53_28510 [Bryobacteraceae bacterium]
MAPSNRYVILAAAIGSFAAFGQTAPVRGKINLPSNSPVSLLSADWGESGVQARGGAMVVDLRLSLQLRNEDQRRIRGVTLAVLTRQSALGGKAWITVPTLDVGAGEAFPVRWNVQLLRPIDSGGGPDVEVTLDGVLFDNLSFFGPDQMKSRRAMTVWELESRRDRKYFRSLLESQGENGLRAAIVDSVQRQQERGTQPGMSLASNRVPRVTNSEIERRVDLAFLNFPGSPVEPLSGVARIAGNEAVVPRFEIRNKSDRWVKHFEMGLIVRDKQGHEFLAGTAPADPSLAPGQRSQVTQEASLRMNGAGTLDSIGGVITSVEFSDGQFWIPSRAEIAGDAALRRVIPPSPEEQRLMQIYRKRGLSAVIEELKRVN